MPETLHHRPPALRDRLSAAINAFKGLTWTAGNWVDSDASGNRYSSGPSGRSAAAGGRFGGAAGDSWDCPAWLACQNYEARGLASAPPVVQVLNSEGKWEFGSDQSAAELLMHPARGWRDPDTGEVDMTVSAYSWPTLLYNILLSLEAASEGGGNAYLGIDTDNAGFASRLWWLPHNRVKPVSASRGPGEQATGNLIDFYEYQPPGRDRLRYKPQEIVHIRFGLDPADRRLGLSPARAASMGIYTLQRAALYGANIMRRHGAVSVYASPKPRQKDDYESPLFDPKQWVNDWNDLHSGDRVGGAGACDLPLDIQKLNTNPQDMALDTIPDRHEADIAALRGLPVQVIGLFSGRLMQTRANMQEAREIAAEEAFIPKWNILAEAFTTQLLPRTRGWQADMVGRVRIVFDYSAIRTLQPDKDKQHVRVRDDYKAGLIDRYQALVETGRAEIATEQDRGVYATASGGNLPPAAPVALTLAMNSNGNGTGGKVRVAGQRPVYAGEIAQFCGHDAPEPARSWAERVTAEIAALEAELPAEGKNNPNHDPHSGQFAPGGGHAEITPTESARAMRARQTSRHVGRDVQQYSEEHCEGVLAKGVGGVSLRDNEPVDVMVINSGVVKHGIELKVMTDNKNAKLTMKKDALTRKQEWQREHQAPLHTVVFDDHRVFNAEGPGKHGPESDRRILYRRGYGSFRVENMHEVGSMAELRTLMNSPIADLPAKARPSASYVEIDGKSMVRA